MGEKTLHLWFVRARIHLLEKKRDLIDTIRLAVHGDSKDLHRDFVNFSYTMDILSRLV